MSLKTKRPVKQINLFSLGIASQLCSTLLLGDVLHPLLEVTKELSPHIALQSKPTVREELIRHETPMEYSGNPSSPPEP